MPNEQVILALILSVDLVVIPNPPPTVTITSPVAGDTVIEGSTIALAAEATDNGAVVRVDFSTDTGFLQSDFSTPYVVPFTIPLEITELTVNASAFDDLSKEGLANPVTVNVIPDPLTTVVGSVVDPDNAPVDGATLIANGDVPGTSLADGSFSIPDVPTILGDIVVGASANVNALPLFGSSAGFPPVLGGTTDVGTIQLIPGFPNGNGGFETGDFTGYTTAGNASVIQSLGSVLPPEGTFMAMISTGPAGSTGLLRTEEFMVPAGVTQILFDFNFMTDELDELSTFNDFFVARILRDPDPPIEVVRISKNDMNAGLFPILPAPSGFDGMTGFLTGTADISEFAGTMVALDFCFFVSDVGDTIVDSAALIDDLRFAQAGGAGPPVCGNGVIEAGELCDDGNTISGEGCDDNCQLELAFAACVGGDGDCCTANGSPGCNEPACCELVCAVDPVCCEVAWDDICAEECIELCIGD